MNQIEAIQFVLANYNEGSNKTDLAIFALISEIAGKNHNVRFDADSLQAKIDEIEAL